MRKDGDPRLRSFGFRWYCVCGASWEAKLTRTPGDPDIKPVLDMLRKEWEKVHSGSGHRPTESGHVAAWARRKAEAEAAGDRP